MLRNRNIDDLGSTLDAEKEISDKVPGGSHCLSPLSLLLIFRREMLQGVRLALGYKLRDCRRISYPSLVPWVSRKMGPCFLLEKCDGIWCSCCCTAGGWLLQAPLCPATPLSPLSPPHSPRLVTLSPVIPSSALIASCRTRKGLFSIRKKIL